jgi:deoxycytidylate deaminase
MEVAIKEAKKSPMKSKYGAVLLYHNKVISSGYNTYTNISSLNKNCPLHTSYVLNSC